MEVLEQQVKETGLLLQETQKKKEEIEDELKAAVDKVALNVLTNLLFVLIYFGVVKIGLTIKLL